MTIIELIQFDRGIELLLYSNYNIILNVSMYCNLNWLLSLLYNPTKKKQFIFSYIYLYHGDGCLIGK